MYTIMELLAASSAIKKTARENCESEEHVRNETRKAIAEAIDRCEPHKRARLAAFCHDVSKPTPEEFMLWIISEADMCKGRE